MNEYRGRECEWATSASIGTFKVCCDAWHRPHNTSPADATDVRCCIIKTPFGTQLYHQHQPPVQVSAECCIHKELGLDPDCLILVKQNWSRQQTQTSIPTRIFPLFDSNDVYTYLINNALWHALINVIRTAY